MAAKKKTDSSVPAKATKHEVATIGDYGDYSKKGFEGTTQDDYAIPYLNVLQGLSPEVQDGTDGSIEGAKPGMLMNSVSKRLWPGKEGVLFVPVCRQRLVVEWRPRDAGGGLVARHEISSEFVRSTPRGEKGEWVTEEGNELVDTFYLFGFTLEDIDAMEPEEVMVMSFWSTKIKKYRQIMWQMDKVKNGPPMFANRLRVKTVQEKNNQGTFFNYDISFANGTLPASLIPHKLEDGSVHPLLLYGDSLREQIMGGQRKMADETAEQHGSGPKDAEGRPLF